MYRSRTCQGVSDRNGRVVRVSMVVELTLFWSYVGVILVDCRVPHNTPIYNEMLPCMEGEMPRAQATVHTSGKRLIPKVAYLRGGLCS